MGFSGRIVLARGDGWAGDVAVLDRTDFAGGWAAITYDKGPKPSPRELAAQTAAPVLVANVMDSDCADVRAASPAEASWHAYLREEIAYEYGAPELDQSTAEVVDAVVEWAAEAGLDPDRDLLVEAFAAEDTFVEETLARLFAGLGLVRLGD